MSIEKVFLPTGPPASGRVTPASFPFYTTGEDNLRVTTYNSAAGVSLKITGRLLDAAGRATSDIWTHTPNTDRSAKSTDITLSGSTLLNLTVFAGAGTPNVGQTFVIVKLIRGIGAGAIVLGTILQGYVTIDQALGFPGSALQQSSDGPGAVRTIAGTVPAAGAEVAETVPTGARWELLLFTARFVPQAPLGINRMPMLYAQLAGLTLFFVPIGRTVDAPNALSCNWSSGLGLQANNVAVYAATGLPVSIPLLGGTILATLTDGLQAADTYTVVNYTVREWLEVP